MNPEFEIIQRQKTTIDALNKRITELEMSLARETAAKKAAIEISATYQNQVRVLSNKLANIRKEAAA